MSPDLRHTRASDRWLLPSTMAGLFLILLAGAGMLFGLVPPVWCLSIGVLGGILVQGESVLGFWRVMRRPKLK
jgi:hypothetical protein